MYIYKCVYQAVTYFSGLWFSFVFFLKINCFREFYAQGSRHICLCGSRLQHTQARVNKKQQPVNDGAPANVWRPTGKCIQRWDLREFRNFENVIKCSLWSEATSSTWCELSSVGTFRKFWNRLVQFQVKKKKSTEHQYSQLCLIFSFQFIANSHISPTPSQSLVYIQKISNLDVCEAPLKAI